MRATPSVGPTASRRLAALLPWLFLGLPPSGCGTPPGPDPAQQIRQALALPEGEGPPLAARVEESWRRRDAVVERLRFQGRHGPVPALAAYSDMAHTRPLPVLLCMPGSPNRKEDLIQPLDLLPTWAQKGFFVVSIDRPYHGQRPGDRERQILMKGLPRVLGEYVDDLQRALDYAATRPEADPDRVGMLGLSMGGLEALLLAAVDDRVGCVVSVSGQLSWREVFGGESWKLIFTGMPLAERLRARGASGDEVYAAFLDETPQLAALDGPFVAAAIAPRPLLLMTGGDDPYATPAGALRTHDVAAVAYGAGAADRLHLWVEDGVGHAFSAAMERRALDWFTYWLRPGASPSAGEP